ncbi:hypothetical protein HMPREF1084_03338 [Clostridium butyricum 60E.3]|uniref:cache domain-containing protein n=1 Tax=Clostridium butyricum TaxID=1492 RepID=UPI0002D1D971|nr:cache domain-containing protein [Clostridium butyricum]ENZ30163.1 hypothetical protein HMPREF1084_04009 [Clostridium butyricum 60E.3]ENZ30765.1 hypothetical protein HMPREF1084_03338 [Clostridium butyricum 60E.3]
MMRFKHKRKSIYIILICVIFIIFFLFCYIYNMKKVHEISLKELSDTIMELKENRLKEIIDRTINEIDIEREFVLDESSKSLQSFSDNLDSVQLNNIDFENKESLKKFFSPYIKLYPKLEILIWNKSSDKLIYTNNIQINAKNPENENQFMDYINSYKINTYIQKNNNIIALCISDDSIENDVKNRIQDRIRNTNFSPDGYIWINQILNYNGGDDYAIRLVHPNLIETEGEKLSTNIKDIKGNLPYLTELEGIKKNGEVLYDYYFKKKDSNYISHKLSYAKLYSKYNWIISTGLYLDDLEALISKKDELFRKKIQLQVTITIIVTILSLVIFGLIFLVQIESKKLRKISLIKQKNDIISQHYSILERKYDKTNQIIHDIKNHLICINALATYNQSKKIIEYIKNINEDINQLSDIVITNNKMLDIIINDKIHLINKYNINFKYEVQSFNLDFIKNKDMCSMMSNLLDNSIESCIKSYNKNILLKIQHYNKSFIIIKLINSCDKNPILKNNKLISSKQNTTYHGYGIENIKKSVNKYSGNMTWKYNESNKEFSTIIVFPITHN